MKVLFVHLDNIILCPPALNAISILLDLNHEVTIMAYNTEQISQQILCKNNCKVINLGERKNPQNVIGKYLNRFNNRVKIRKYFGANFKKFDLVWTTSEITVREIGNKLLKCQRHVMQLMELVNYVPRIGNLKWFTFPIEKYAQHAETVVVPEYNRAHIVKARWKLEKLPIILPNKPYDIKIGELSDAAKEMIEIVKREKRKILLYQGGFTKDRRFEEFAEAAKELGSEYCMYMMGVENDYCKEIVRKYPNVVYLGALTPPEHLVIAKYAYLGILTYIPIQTSFYSELNALYCAPNKIYEYALYDLPMIGTDVPGLSEIFDKYNIGVACEEISSEAIVRSIKNAENKYDEMKMNCSKFYNSVDLVEIMKGIIK